MTYDNAAPPTTTPTELPAYAWPADLMTARQVADTVRLTPKTVRQHIRAGRLRAVRFGTGNGYRIRREDAQAWVRRTSSPPTAAARPSTKSSPPAADPHWPAHRARPAPPTPSTTHAARHEQDGDAPQAVDAPQRRLPLLPPRGRKPY